MIPFFFYIKAKLDKIDKYKKILEVFYTIIQIFAPIQQYLIMRKYNYIYNSFHVIYCCFFVFIIANDYGYLSNITNNKILNKLKSCQYEVYILQFKLDIFFRKLYSSKFKKNQLYIEMLFHLKLILLFLISYNYKIFLKEKLAKLMDIIIEFLSKIFN